eukprot:530385-Pyramimonas_sp.AAC.1
MAITISIFMNIFQRANWRRTSQNLTEIAVMGFYPLTRLCVSSSLRSMAINACTKLVYTQITYIPKQTRSFETTSQDEFATKHHALSRLTCLAVFTYPHVSS